MADTTALKNRIRAAIKANDNQEITGPVLQQSLLDIVDELDLSTELQNEVQQRQNGDSTLQQGINTERQQRQDADTQLGQRLKYFRLVGRDMEIVRAEFPLMGGRRYRIYLNNNYQYPAEISPSQYAFQIYYKINSVGTVVEGVYSNSRPKPYYDFTTIDADTYGIMIRAANGQIVDFEINELSAQNYAILLGSTTVPNISTDDSTITFPSDSGFFCKGYGVTQPTQFVCPFSMSADAGGSRILFYNANTRTLHIEQHTYVPTEFDFIVGAIKTSAGGSLQSLCRCDFPFEYTINGKTKVQQESLMLPHNNYCVLLGSTSLPNINTTDMSMTFPSDCGFYCNGYGVLDPSSYTASIAATSGGGSRILYFKASTRTLHLEIYTFTPAVDDFIVGAIKLNNTVNPYSYIRSDFPFEYTVNGKHEIEKKLNHSTYCILLGSTNIPNIDTAAKTMTFPSDSGFCCKEYGVLQPADFTVSIGATSGGGSRILYFNASTRTLHLEVHTYTPSVSDFVVGAIKLNTSGGSYSYIRSDFPFEYTVNGNNNFLSKLPNVLKKNNYCVLLGSLTLPNIDTSAMTMTFPSDCGFYCNYYGVLNPADYTVSIGATSGGGSRILYFNAETRTLHLELYTFTPAISDFIVGAIKLNINTNPFSYVRSDFPFEYTVNGKSNFDKSDESSQYYRGRDISLKHKIEVKTISVTTPSALTNSQGMAIYDNYLVRCNDNMACVAIYNATTFELLYALTPSSQQPDLHCNTVSFGIEKYDSADPLPLLYCPAERNNNIYVYRILPDFSGFVLVQTIDVSVFANHPYYYPNGVVDLQNKKLVLTGWNKHENGAGNNLDPDAYIGIAICRLPLLSEGNVALVYGDIEKEFEYPGITVTQGAQMFYGRLYQVAGLPGRFQADPYIKLGVIDTNEEQVVNVITLNDYGITVEPEGLAIKDGKVYIDLRGSTLASISF